MSDIGSGSTQSLEFRGSASEYFRIWIVNLLLTILTLGVYSAWAKVRRRKYFYRNTYLDGHNFDYHANPLAILKGRLIAVPILVLYFASGYFFPGLDLVILLLLGLLLPWLIVRSQIFNRRNTSYRNLRFDFSKCFGAAYSVFLKYGLLTVVTFGLAYPLFDFKRRELIVENTGFGNSNFQFEGKSNDFYNIYVKAWGLALLIVVGVIVISMAIVPALAQQPPVLEDEVPQLTLLSFLPMIAILLSYLPIIAYMQSRIANFTVSNTSIESSRLTSVLRARDLTQIYATNLLGIIFSMGLLIPWASVRLARYRVEHSGIDLVDSLDQFIGKAVERATATGEEIADIFDFEVGIG